MTLQTHKIYIANDHASIELKNFLKQKLQDTFPKLEIQDFGVSEAVSVDYPHKAKEVAQAIKKDPKAFGLLLCGTGIGISIAANRFSWMRAALIHTTYEAEITRLHNNANAIVFGGRTIGPENAWHALSRFLITEFEAGRHERRVNQLANELTS